MVKGVTSGVANTCAEDEKQPWVNVAPNVRTLGEMCGRASGVKAVGFAAMGARPQLQVHFPLWLDYARFSDLRGFYTLRWPCIDHTLFSNKVKSKFVPVGKIPSNQTPFFFLSDKCKLTAGSDGNKNFLPGRGGGLRCVFFVWSSCQFTFVG